MLTTMKCLGLALLAIAALGGRPAAAAECCETCASLGCRQCRAGCPQSISHIATPTNTPHYGGYYVGGGTLKHGEGRYCNEGVWGWDYMGVLFQKRVWLGWSHGRRYQDGTGAYKTDGPHIIPEH